MKTLAEKRTFLINNIDVINPPMTVQSIKSLKEDIDTVVELVQQTIASNEVVDESSEKEDIPMVSELKYETLMTESGEPVNIVWLPFLKYSLRKTDGVIRTQYQFQFGANKITTQNGLLNPIKKDIEIGSLFPFKVDSIELIVSDKVSKYGYGSTQYFSAGIAEFACELLQNQRLEQEEELAELAELTPEAQALIAKSIASAQTEKYLAKRGLKMPEHLK